MKTDKNSNFNYINEENFVKNFISIDELRELIE